MINKLELAICRKADIEDLKQFINEVSSDQDKNTLSIVLKNLNNEYYTSLENLQAEIEKEKNWVSQEQKNLLLKTA